MTRQDDILRWGCAREPKRTCQGPKTHPHVSALQQSSGEAQSGRSEFAISWVNGNDVTLKKRKVYLH